MQRIFLIATLFFLPVVSAAQSDYSATVTFIDQNEQDQWFAQITVVNRGTVDIVEIEASLNGGDVWDFSQASTPLATPDPALGNQQAGNNDGETSPSIVWRLQSGLGNGETFQVIADADDDSFPSSSLSADPSLIIRFEDGHFERVTLSQTADSQYAGEIEMPSGSGSVDLRWTPPTENEDGSPLTDLAGYRIYYGLDDGGPYPHADDISDPSAIDYTVERLAAGDWYFVATAYNLANVESAYSGQAARSIQANPDPPQNLQVVDITVFTVLKRDNRFVLLPVGTVPVGTPCDSEQSVNGRHAVDVAAVQWTGTVRPVVVVADCQ